VLCLPFCDGASQEDPLRRAVLPLAGAVAQQFAHESGPTGELRWARVTWRALSLVRLAGGFFAYDVGADRNVRNTVIDLYELLMERYRARHEPSLTSSADSAEQDTLEAWFRPPAVRAELLAAMAAMITGSSLAEAIVPDEPDGGDMDASQANDAGDDLRWLQPVPFVASRQVLRDPSAMVRLAAAQAIYEVLRRTPMQHHADRLRAWDLGAHLARSTREEALSSAYTWLAVARGSPVASVPATVLMLATLARGTCGHSRAHWAARCSPSLRDGSRWVRVRHAFLDQG